MMTRERQGRFFLVFSSLTLLLTQSNGQNVPNTQPRSGVEILVSLAVNNSASSTLDIERQTQIASFFASQTQAGCGTRCSVNASNVVFSEIGTGTATDPVSTALIFSMRVRIELPDNSVVLAVQSSLKLSQSVLTESLLASPDLGLSIHVYAIAYTRQADRPFVCGDNIIQNAEICDDGNTIDGDGCSAECTLEDGFMCYGAVRTGMANVTGKKGEWRVDALTNIKNFIVLDTAETCAKDGICIQATNPWVPSYFSAAYALGPVTSLAPGGFYCKDFCTDTFTPPKFYDFKNSCVPTGIDECSLGESTCDTNAYCTEPADKVGYSCECDEKYFVSTLHGASCATSGVEVEFKMGGMVLGSGTSGPGCVCNDLAAGCAAVPTLTKYLENIMPDASSAFTLETSPIVPFWKYAEGILVNGNIYLIPTSANAVGKFNPATLEFSTIDMSAYRDYLLADGTVFREPAADGMAQGYALRTWLPAYQSGSNTMPAAYSANSDRLKYRWAILVGSIIYCIPFKAASIGMIDTTTDTFSTVLGLKNVFQVSISNLDIVGAVLAPNGFIYIFTTTIFVKFDPATKVSTVVTFNPGSVFKECLITPNGNVYFIPQDGDIAVFDTNTEAISSISTNGALASFPAPYWDGVLHPNGKIYLAPYFAANIGVIDTLTNTFSTIDISSVFPWGSTAETSWQLSVNTAKYNKAVVGEGGKIYFLPARARHFARYDPTTGVFELIFDVLPTYTRGNAPLVSNAVENSPEYSSALMIQRKMYLVPSNAGGVGVIDFGCCESCPPPANIETNRQNMVEARLIFIDELFRQKYLNAQSSPALLIEGVNRYPIDMVSELIEDPLSPLYGRSLWRIVLRAPDVHLNLAKLAQGTIFDDTGTWARVFNDSSKFMVSRVGQCANDRARSCNSGNPSCLNAALCITDRADFTVKKLDAGGTTAPLQVDSSGLDVMSVEYDITQSAFKIRMRYDNTIPGVINTVFVSNMGVGQDPIFLPTFSSDEFPCLPIGTGLFQNQRDNSGAAETVFRVG